MKRTITAAGRTANTGPDARTEALIEELSDLEERYFAEDAEDTPEMIERRLVEIEAELRAATTDPVSITDPVSTIDPLKVAAPVHHDEGDSR